MDLFADLPPPGKNCYIIYHGDNKGENYCILQRSYRHISYFTWQITVITKMLQIYSKI